MRDPKRIPPMCRLLEQAWSLSPEERLGQFIQNLATFGMEKDGDVRGPEDDVWEAALKQYIAKERDKRKAREK